MVLVYIRITIHFIPDIEDISIFNGLLHCGI